VAKRVLPGLIANNILTWPAEINKFYLIRYLCKFLVSRAKDLK